jgi:YHS domain-containing protein
MKQSKSLSKDPICGMTVDEATALHTERDGKTFYFCSDSCRQKFLAAPAGAKPADKSGGCCGQQADVAGAVNSRHAEIS